MTLHDVDESGIGHWNASMTPTDSPCHTILFGAWLNKSRKETKSITSVTHVGTRGTAAIQHTHAAAGFKRAMRVLPDLRCRGVSRHACRMILRVVACYYY